MAFNGSGTFNRVRNWVNDAAAGIKIRADYHDSEDDNFATGLSQCITKDGQTTVTANLPMATYRHTNVGAATERTHYARYDQVQDGKINWSDAGGTADAITTSYNPPITALVDGQLCYVRAGAANATTTPTFSPNSLTARTIVKYGGSALVAGDIVGDGHELILRYQLANTRWELLNPLDKETDELIKISSNDTTTGYLEDKLLVGTGLSLTTQNDGANETRTIDLSAASTTSIGGVEKATATETQDGTANKFPDASEIAARYQWQYGTSTSLSGSSTELTTSIPAWATEVEVLVDDASHDGTDVEMLLQLGDSGGYETTGYKSIISAVNNGASAVSVETYTNGIAILDSGADDNNTVGSVARLSYYGSNKWLVSGVTNRNNVFLENFISKKTLSDTLTSIRIIVASGSFDDGTAVVRWR